MSAVSLPARSPSLWRDGAAFVWHAWRGTARKDWAVVLLIGLIVALISAPMHLEMVRKAGWHPLPTIAQFALPFVASAMMFLGWRLADAGSDRWRSRRVRLVYALFGGSAVTALVGVFLWQQTGAAELWAQVVAEKGKAPPVIWLILAAEYVNILIIGGWVYALCEVFRQRCETQREFDAALRQRGALEHELLESRLAAMQAQVEPRFLFDSLVDIGALYDKDAPRAAENFDRLIGYLRAALPRLREAGSTIGAELELVQSYLAVVASLHGRPSLRIAVADDCGSVRFYPMLLLPLVQRAVRRPGGLPEEIAIDVRREAQSIAIAMRVSCTGGCADDAELARVRERLAGLCGSAATLDCVESAQATELTMRIAAAAP